MPVVLPFRLLWMLYIRLPLWILRHAPTNRWAWLASIYGSAAGCAAMIGLGVGLLADDRPGWAFAATLAGGVLALLSVWALAAHRAASGADAYATIGRYSSRRLGIVAALALLFALAATPGLASFQSTIPIHNSASTFGIVESIPERGIARIHFITSDDELAMLIELSNLTWDDAYALDSPVMSATDLTSLEFNAYGEPVEKCVDGEQCMLVPFRSALDLVPQQIVTMRVEPSAGIVFLEGDSGSVFSYFITGVILFMISACVALATQCRQASLWQQSRRSLN
jgi:hypothetical protein